MGVFLKPFLYMFKKQNSLPGGQLLFHEFSIRRENEPQPVCSQALYLRQMDQFDEFPFRSVLGIRQIGNAGCDVNSLPPVIHGRKGNPPLFPAPGDRHQGSAEPKQVYEFLFQGVYGVGFSDQEIQHPLRVMPHGIGDQGHAAGGHKQGTAVESVPDPGIVPGLDIPLHVNGHPFLHRFHHLVHIPADLMDDADLCALS